MNREAGPPGSSITVLVPGPFTIIVDDGRRGRGHQGVARSGAIDQKSRALANRLVGNDPGAAVLEMLLGPAEFLSGEDTFVAVTGARSGLSINGAACGLDAACRVPPGSLVRIGSPTVGLRTYVAFRGGVATEVVLGSRSYDTLGKIGRPPLQAGDVLPLGPSDAAGTPWLEPVPVAPLATGVTATITLGPREDWISAASLAQLLSEPWIVRSDSDRTGIRLAGPALERRETELASEAMIPGAIQVPANGQPIVLGPDCGTTGGYPVVGVVVADDLGKIGQMRPGDTIRFTAKRR